MRWLKHVLLFLLFAFVAIQFIPPERNVGGSEPPAALVRRFPVPVEIGTVLRSSCFDCHSNTTVYPWYFNIQPVGWWLADHVKEGKSHLNFDEFLNYALPRQYHAFEEVREMIERDEMPLASYTLLHREAVLTEESSFLILEWSDAMRDSMQAWYPADSLVRRRQLPAQ